MPTLESLKTMHQKAIKLLNEMQEENLLLDKRKKLANAQPGNKFVAGLVEKSNMQIETLCNDYTKISKEILEEVNSDEIYETMGV